MNDLKPECGERMESGARRMAGRVLSWRAARWTLLILAGLVTLLALTVSFENWRGKRAWDRFRAEMEARGERLDLAAFLPAEVPPEENFCATPFLAGGGETNRKPDIQLAEGNGSEGLRNGDWARGERVDLAAWQSFYRGNTNYPAAPADADAAQTVLAALGRFDAVVDELRQANQRPREVMALPAGMISGDFLNRLSAIKQAVSLLRMRAVAKLAEGDSAGALEEIRLGFRLVEACGTAPLLISQLVQMACGHAVLQPVWEGCASGGWTAIELSELDRLLSRLRPLEAYAQGMRVERAFGFEMLKLYRHGRMPLETSVDPDAARASSPVSLLGPFNFAAMWYRNQIAIGRSIQDRILPLVDPVAHRFDLDAWRRVSTQPARGGGMYSLFARLQTPALVKVASKFARFQAEVDLARVAIALEQHRIAQGHYPEQLDSLASRFLDRVPPDVMTGQPLEYRREADGRFVLYSVGTDGRDDHGAWPSSAVIDGRTQEQGDWVWRYSRDAN